MSKRKSQKKEIIWNVVNSLLSGALVLVGALTTGGITGNSIGAALLTAFGVAIVQFKDYWTSEKDQYKCTPLFKFL